MRRVLLALLLCSSQLYVPPIATMAAEEVSPEPTRTEEKAEASDEDKGDSAKASKKKTSRTTAAKPKKPKHEDEGYYGSYKAPAAEADGKLDKGTDGYYGALAKPKVEPTSQSANQPTLSSVANPVSSVQPTPSGVANPVSSVQPASSALTVNGGSTEGFTAPGSQSGSVAVTTAPTPAPISAKKTFLWKATKGDQTVYLLGTIHVAKQNFYPLPPEIENAFNSSKDLYLECDMTVDEKLKKMQEVKTMYLKGDTLSKHLSPETKRAFNDYLTWAGESMEMYQQFQPAFAAGCIATSALRRAGYNGSLGIDEHFYKQAKQAKKPVIGLEPMSMHMAGASALTAGKTNTQLDQELGTIFADVRECQGKLDEILRLWKEADLEKFDRRDLAENKTNPETFAEYKRIVWDRNVTMTDALLRLMKGPGPHFVAVGAAHLGTDNGMVALLKQKGFNVEQVTASPPATHRSPSGKLSRLSFPDGQFSILLPGKPEMEYKDLPNGLRMVRYHCMELPFGLYDVSYILCPGDLASQPAKMVMDVLSAAYIKAMQAKDFSTREWRVPGGFGREVTMTRLGGNSDGVKELAKYGIDTAARFRMCVVGSRFFIIGAIGTAPWLKSPATQEYLDSFRPAEASFASHRSTKSNSYSSSSYSSQSQSAADYEATHRKHEDETRRREDNWKRDRNSDRAQRTREHW